MCGISALEQMRADLRYRAHAAKLHRAHQLARQDLERAQRARLPARHRAEERRPPGKHRVRAERARFEHVHAGGNDGNRDPDAAAPEPGDGQVP